ncbi:hypothetical protein MK280_05405, partial [Myxococcota bacterium]|nr:hypothetical protein [Myxococcota bacterium]
MIRLGTGLVVVLTFLLFGCTPSPPTSEPVEETTIEIIEPTDSLQSAMAELILSLQAVEEDIRQSPAF